MDLLDLKLKLASFITVEKLLAQKEGHFTLKNTAYHGQQHFTSEMTALKDFPCLMTGEDSIRVGLKAFHNSCPHRGARLAVDKDSATIVCPYHGWTFDQDGVLLRSSGHHCPYRPGSFKLKERSVVHLGGIPFEDKGQHFIGAFKDEISHLAQGKQELCQRTQRVHCNWKLIVESLLETYHFPFAHAEFLKNFEEAFFSHQTQEGHNSRLIVPLQDFEQRKDVDDLQGINIMYFVFPFSFILFMKSGIVSFKIIPLTDETSELTSTLFGENDEGLKAFSLLEQILQQDFAILESQQRNLKIIERHHLTPYETLIRHFHENLGQTLNQASPMDQHSYESQSHQIFPKGPYPG